MWRSTFQKYIFASTVIKMMGKGSTPMAEILRKKAYINDRCSGRVTFIDRSKTITPNRLDFFKEIRFDCRNRVYDLSPNASSPTTN